MYRPCNYVNHHLSGSKYDKDKVPIELFINKYGIQKYTRCPECRIRARKSKKKTLENRKRKQITEDEFHCKNCNIICKKDEMINDIMKCKSCKTSETKQDGKRHINYIKVLSERITEMDYCCEICLKIFIRTEKGRFIEQDAKISNGIDIETVEFDNLVFTNLTDNKEKSVRSLRSYDAMKAASKKRQLLCLLCRCKERLRKFEEYRKYNGLILQHNEKELYIENIKQKSMGCEICKFNDKTCLSYLEFDHIDPSTKIFTIGPSVRSSYTLDEIKAELEKCRILCKFCHKKQTNDQITQKEIYPTKRMKNDD